MEHVGVGQKIIGIRISRIQREGGGEITFSFGKMVATSIDVAGENEERRAIRQTRACDREFFQSAAVISLAPKKIIGECKMRLSGIGTKPQCCLYCGVGEGNPVRGWIEIEKEEEIVRARYITIRRHKVGVAINRFIE